MVYLSNSENKNAEAKKGQSFFMQRKGGTSVPFAERQASLSDCPSDFYLGDGMYRGYIKLWRKIRDWLFFQKPLALALWVTLLCEANHKPIKKFFNGKKIMVKPGQLLTGRKYLAQLVGISEWSVEKYLKEFIAEQQIIQQTSTKNRLITILNWKRYQDNHTTDHTTNHTTKRQQTIQQKDTPKNDKNNKNDKISKDTAGIFDYFLLKTKKNYKLTPARAKLIKDRLKDYSTEDIKAAIDNFVRDSWDGRKDHMDLVYCIGIRNKIDNLEKWLNKAPRETPDDMRYKIGRIKEDEGDK